MSQNEENETVDRPAEAPTHPTQPPEANPEARPISMQSEEPAESVESIESVETKTDNAEIADITENDDIDAKDIPGNQGIRLVDEAEETPSDSLRIRRIDDEAEPAQAQTPTQSQTARPAQATRNRTPRSVGREPRSEGQGRRVLSAVRPRTPRFVSDQEAYVPNVEQVTRQQTSDYSRAFITKRVIFNCVSRPIAWFDRHVIDGFFNGLAYLSQRASYAVRVIQSGQVQQYAYVILLGTVVIAALVLWLL